MSYHYCCINLYSYSKIGGELLCFVIFSHKVGNFNYRAGAHSNLVTLGVSTLFSENVALFCDLFS